MEQETKINARENIEIPEEIDTEKIKRLFVELPFEKIEFLANHLMRPDGFAKTLITGSICTSEELQNAIDWNFAKPHRSYYMAGPRTGSFSDTNDYLSFGVGKAQQMYQMGNPDKPMEKAKENGLGFTVPAKKLIENDIAIPSWLCIGLNKMVEREKEHFSGDPRFIKYINLSDDQLSKLDERPQKEDFLTLIDMARKAGELDGRDQAEINMRKTNDKYPRFSVDEMIVLIPEKQRQTFEYYLQKKIREVQKYAEEIKRMFGVDVAETTVDSVLSRKNIYWYPQENIEIAVEYLTTHPEKINEFLPQEK
ncbi:MAG: hypothetical protein WC878_04180 [Candidatus Paceibacterota bacterium]|jgi:hypothetical protein